MILKLALGSLWMAMLRRQGDGWDEAVLEREIEAQLRALREHLFER